MHTSLVDLREAVNETQSWQDLILAACFAVNLNVSVRARVQGGRARGWSRTLNLETLLDFVDLAVVLTGLKAPTVLASLVVALKDLETWAR
jgi:hypothetical protein